MKLADLGLARITDDEKWGLSEAGMAIGTPYYISPEQVRGQTNIDIRADIYSLGATLYHMVTGTRALRRRDPQRGHAQARRPQGRPSSRPTTSIPTLSGGLGMVVETMMAKNREHRYQSPDDLILDLKCLLRDESPMIAGQKPESPGGPGRRGVRRLRASGGTASEDEMVEMASYVNNRNHIIATMAMLLAVSVITNVILRRGALRRSAQSTIRASSRVVETCSDARLPSAHPRTGAA